MGPAQELHYIIIIKVKHCDNAAHFSELFASAIIYRLQFKFYNLLLRILAYTRREKTMTVVEW